MPFLFCHASFVSRTRPYLDRAISLEGADPVRDDGSRRRAYPATSDAPTP